MNALRVQKFQVEQEKIEHMKQTFNRNKSVNDVIVRLEDKPIPKNINLGILNQLFKKETRYYRECYSRNQTN